MSRRRKAAILTLAALAVCGGLAGAEESTGAGPRAVVPEPVKDFGNVPQGEKVAHDFVIHNEGQTALEIRDVKPGCGCTVAEYDATIPPGGQGRIHAVVDTIDFSGPIAKGVDVYTNDPANPRLSLTVKADVRPYLGVHPGYARYVYVQGEQEGTVGQTVWSPDFADLEIEKVVSPYRYLEVSYRQATPEERQGEDPSGRQWRVEMTLDADAPVGPLSDHVEVYTNHPKQSMVKIPVSGFVRPIIAVTPAVADFGERQLDGPFEASLLVANFATENISLTGVETDLEGVEAEINPLQAGRRYEVRVTLKPEMAKGDFRGTLELHTDSPKKPVVRVQLKGTIL